MQDTTAPATQTKAFHHLFSSFFFPPVDTAWVHHTSLLSIYMLIPLLIWSLIVCFFFSSFFFLFFGGNFGGNMSVHWENCLLVIDECIVINHNS